MKCVTRFWTLAVVLSILSGTIFLVLEKASQAREERLGLAQQDLDRGIALYRQGSYDDAGKALNLATKGNPMSWRAPFYLGVIQIQRGQFEQALPFLEQALKLNPGGAKTANALGVAYFKLNKLDWAKAYFELSAQLEPGNENTRSMLETMTKLQRRLALNTQKPEP